MKKTLFYKILLSLALCLVFAANVNASRVDRINGLVGGIAVKAPVRVATTEAITLSGAQTITGIALNADATPRERVLVKDQASDIENGIYDVNSGAWTRSPDFDGARDAVDGTQILVNEGPAAFNKIWYLSATNPVAIGTDPLTFFIYYNNVEGSLLSTYNCDLPTALAALGDQDPVTLKVDCDCIITSDATITDNISTNIINGGSFDGVAGGGAETLYVKGSFSAGAYEIFGSNIDVSFDGIDYVRPEWWINNSIPGTTLMTTALQTAIDTKEIVRLLSTTYLIDESLKFNGNLFGGIIGTGINSVIQTSANAEIGIELAPTSGVETLTLRDFLLSGTSSNTGGIKFGSEAVPLSPIRVRDLDVSRVNVRNFTKTNAYGISLVAMQEVSFENCQLRDNYNNIHRPAGIGFVTATNFYGASSFIGRADNIGVLLEGTVIDIMFSNKIVFELNANEAIKSTGAGSQITINDCYFEENHQTGGDGNIVIKGTAALGGESRINMADNVFHGSVPTVTNLVLDYNKSSSFVGNDGLYTAGFAITNSVNLKFAQNYSVDDAFDIFTLVALIGGQGTIDDYDSSSGRQINGGFREFTEPFRVKNDDKPTIVGGGGVSSAVVENGSTDQAGQLTFVSNFTGSTRLMGTITFTASLGQVPYIYLQATDTVAFIPTVVSASATSFAVYVDNTTDGVTYVINYFVVGKDV